MNTEQATTEQGTQDRNERGRFVAGNRGGPGNPFARQVAALRRALLDSVTPRDIQDVAGRLVLLAKEGNVQAAKLLFTYTIGKPQPAPEPDHLDADEWNVYKETTPMKQESAAVISAGTPQFHLECVRTTRPVISELMREQIARMVNETPEQSEEREATEAAECERILRSPVEVPKEFADIPSLNGENSAPPPSLNGENGAPLPSANGEKWRSPDRNGRYLPSTNGSLPPDRGSRLPA